MADYPYPKFPPLSIHGLTLQEAYNKLDKEIFQLQSRLFSLRTLRNSLSPISKMPTEVLSEVFSHTQEKMGPSFPDEFDLDTRFYLSWVCRHWRNTALATPTLWTVISLPGKESPVQLPFAKTLLARNHGLCLAVNLVNTTRAVLERFIPQMHRIQHLKLSHRASAPIYDKLLSTPAPVLVSFQVSSNIWHYFPKTTFSGLHPRLHRLICTEVNFNGSCSLITPVLTKLHLECSYSEGNYLVGILPLLLNLTELSLVQAFSGQLVVPLLERIPLPILQILSITESTEIMFGFLGCFDIPQTAITLTWPEKVECPHDAMEGFMLEFSRYQSGAPFPIRYLELECEDPDFSVDIWSTPSQHRVSFRFPGQNLREEHTEIFVSSLSQLDHLEALVINGLPSAALTRLKKLANLTSIKLHAGMAMDQFLDGFKIGPKVEKKKIPFPALKELILWGCQFEDDDLPRLEEGLAARKRADIGLDELVFLGCWDVDVGRCGDFVKIVTVC